MADGITDDVIGVYAPPNLKFREVRYGSAARVPRIVLIGPENRVFGSIVSFH